MNKRLLFTLYILRNLAILVAAWFAVFLATTMAVLNLGFPYIAGAIIALVVSSVVGGLCGANLSIKQSELFD